MPTFALGPAGALQSFRAPGPDYASARARLGGTHETLTGRLIRDTIGYRRSFTLRLPPDLTAEQYSVLEALFEQPGPYRFVDPTRRNLLTANQSSGTDALRTTEGYSVISAGSVASSTAQARSGTRSLAWTFGALGGGGSGFVLASNITTPDSTWAAPLAGETYTFSAYFRSTVAITMKVEMSWRDATGAEISLSSGVGASVGTADWLTRRAISAAAPANTAYVIGRAINTAAAGAGTVYCDDPQLEQAAAATNAVLGTGVPLVSIDSLTPDYSNFALDANPPLLGAELILLEI